MGTGRWLPGYIDVVRQPASGNPDDVTFDILLEDPASWVFSVGPDALLAWYAPHPKQQHYYALLSKAKHRAGNRNHMPRALEFQSAGVEGSLLASHPHLCAHADGVFALRTLDDGVSQVDLLDPGMELPRWRTVVNMYTSTKPDASRSSNSAASIESMRSFDALTLTHARQGQHIFAALLHVGVVEPVRGILVSFIAWARMF